MAQNLDPFLRPPLPVVQLLAACDDNDPDQARDALHPDLIDDISEMGWDQWWEQTQPSLAGYGDPDTWAITMTDLSWHHKWQQHGRRISIAERTGTSVEPGGVTEGGEPYEVLAGDAVAERTFWVVETDRGWLVRGFGIT